MSGARTFFLLSNSLLVTVITEVGDKKSMTKVFSYKKGLTKPNLGPVLARGSLWRARVWVGHWMIQIPAQSFQIDKMPPFRRNSWRRLFWLFLAIFGQAKKDKSATITGNQSIHY